MIAVVFPGQGSQAPGAGSPWRDHAAWSLVDEAEAATGLPLGSLLLDATAEDLAGTREAQLSVLMSSLLAWRALEASLDTDGIVAVAGHSLGQITALIAAEVVSVPDGIRLAVARADASAASQAATPGAMLALLGADEDQATAACAAAPGQAWVANLNGAGQVVVGGEPGALDAVAARAGEVGVRRTRRLAVDGAFHTPLMQSAADAFAPALAETPFRAPRFPIVTNHDAVAVHRADGWAARLTTHLVRPVRWADVVGRLVELGADTIIEVGPGTTLTGLVKRIAPDVTVRSISSPDHLLQDIDQ
ncbi:MAG: ACP S-malonyltransferase [Acidimicrobiales bacterium]